jgi:hypothetical protein
VIGAALATADYLGQMSANNYPEKLDILYEEFRESEEQLRVPVSRRAFASARDLVEKTPLFWDTIVRPKLEREFQGLVRFLARPYPDGPNAYLAAVEANMDKIQQKIAAYPPAVRGEVAGL